MTARHPIPTAALDDRLGFVGNAGGGKTYSAGTAVERLLAAKARVVIPDPLGVWYGLALDADGKAPSVFRKREALVIFGGPHGDLPLNEHAGGLIGETVAGMAESCILDLSELGTKAAERRFMLAFLTALYKHKTSEPLHVIFDEADMWAPQRVLDKEGEAMKLLGMMETVVRRGRVKGFIPWLITQRPAVLSKNVLSQVDGLVAFKLTSVQDRDAIGDWVEGQADKGQWKAMWGNMATLARGEGVVWIPARSILQTSQFPTKETFDSSRAPARGERVQSAVALQPVNLDKLKVRLSKVEAETKANDPKALRAEIGKLKSEMQKLSVATMDNNRPDPEAIEKAEQRGFDKARKELLKVSQQALNTVTDQALTHIRGYVTELTDKIDTHLKELKRERVNLAGVPIGRSPAPAATAVPRAVSTGTPLSPSRAKPSTPIDRGADGFDRPQTRILNSLAMWKALGHDAPSREMVAAVAGYKPGSGGYNNLLGGLGTMGAIGKPMPGRVSLLTDFVEVLSREDGRDMLIGSLENPQRRLVAALNEAGIISRDALAEATGYTAGSGGFNNLVGSLSTLGIIVKPQPGCVALSEWAQELLSGYTMRVAA